MAAIGRAKRRGASAAGIVSRIACDACLVDTLAGPGLSAVDVPLAAHARKHSIIIATDGRDALTALVRSHHAEHARPSDALPCAGLITLSAINALDTLAAVNPRATEWRIASAAGVIGLVTGSAAAGHALAKVRIVTIGVGYAANTGRPIGSIGTEGRVAIAAGIIGWVTDRAAIGYALLAIAIIVAQAA